jgi:hypothetical protein
MLMGDIYKEREKEIIERKRKKREREIERERECLISDAMRSILADRHSIKTCRDAKCT